MKRHLYLIVLFFSFSALKSNAQCNGWVPLGTFDSIQVSFDSASYTAIASPNNSGPPIIVYSDAKVGGKISAVYPTIAGKWKNFGKEGFSTGPVEYTCIAYGKGSKPYVAYEDLANNRLTVKQAATANSWTAALGTNAASLTNARFISLAIDTSSGFDSVYVAYSDGTASNKLNVMKLKGPSWVPVGTKDFSTGAVTYISLKINNKTPYVVYSDSANGWKCTIEDFTGGTWKLYGTLLSVAGVLSTKGAAYNSLVFDNSNSPYIAFQDSNNGNKGALVAFGTLALTFNPQVSPCTFNSDIATGISMCLDGNGTDIDIVYNDVTKGFVNALRFTPNVLLGGAYAVLGAANLSAGSASFCGITSVKLGGNPTPFVVYKDAKAGGKATAMAYNIASNNLWDYIFWPIGITNNPTANPPAYGYNTSLAISKGIPYVAYTDANGNTDNVSVMSYSAGNWAYVGPRGSVSTAAGLSPQIGTDGAGNVYTAYIDGPSGYPYLKEFSGGAWQPIGTTGQVLNKAAHYISLAFDGSNHPYVITDNNGGQAICMEYNGGWNNVGGGGGFSLGNASYISSTYDKSSNTLYALVTDTSDPYGAYFANILYYYNGGSWKNTSISTAGAAYNAVAVDNLGDVYVAYQDLTTSRAEVWLDASGTLNATASGPLGTSYVSPGSATNISLKFDSLNNLYLSYNDGTNQNKLTVMEYPSSGSAWVTVGNAGVSSGEIEGNTSIAISGITPFVAYQDRGPVVQRYNAPATGQITVTPSEAITCPGSSIKLTASGAANYTWYPGGLTGSTISVTNTGGNMVQFSATAILAAGCPADTGKAFVAISTGADNIFTVIGNGYGAGSVYYGNGGYTGDGGPSLSAELNTVTGVAFNPAADTMYLADQQNSVVRQVVMKTGIIITIAGSYANGGNFSGDGGPATAAGLSWPSAVAYNKGNLYIADQSNSCIRKVNLKTGTITSVAGNGNTGAGFSGDGAAATAANLYNPTSITFDGAGNLYIADYENHVVRMVNTTGVISTFAGQNGVTGFSSSGLAATASALTYPAGVSYDALGNNIYIADQYNSIIYKVNIGTGKMYVVAGDTVNLGVTGFSGDGGQAKSAVLNGPIGVTVDPTGNIFIADEHNERIREISTTGIINTIAGNGTLGYSGDGGSATLAELGNPWAVTLDPAGNIYIPDNFNNVVREIKVCAGVLSVVINPPGKPDTICPGGHDTLKAFASGGTPPYTYSWSTGTSGTSSSITVSPTLTSTYSVSVTSNGTGTVTATSTTYTVVVLNTAIATSSTGGTAICSGTNDTIKATGGIATSYRWKPSTGLNATTGSRVVFTAPVVGTATTVTLTVTDTTIQGCPDSAKVIIQVNPTPTITLKASPSTICAGSSTTLTGSGATYYTWSPASGLNKTQSSGPVIDTVKVTTTYTAVGTASAGCNSAKDSITVTVNPSPTVTLTATLHSFCKGDSATLTAAGATSYTWSGSGLNSTTGASVVAKPLATTTYTVTGTSAGCMDTAKVIITVSPTPTLSISSSASTICQGGSTTLTAGTASAYLWNTGATTAAITVNPSISTTYTVTGSNGGCSVKDSIPITVTPSFTLSVTASPSVICTGLSSTLTANSSGGGTYTWNTGATGTNIIVNPTTSTTYTVKEVNGNCSATATTTLVVTPFTASLSTSVTDVTCNGLCNGSASISLSGGSPPFKYLWSSGATTSSISSCAGSPTFTVTDSLGCKAKGSVTITQPAPITGSTSSSGSCSGGNTGTASINSVSGGTPPYTYLWSNSETTTSITGLAAGTYSVTVTDAHNCIAMFTVSVNQSSQLVDSIATSLTVNNKCYGAAKGSATVDVSGGTPAYTYTWSSGQTTSTITNLAAGTYTCNVTDKNGCFANAVSVTITEPSTPFIVNTDDTTICGGVATLHAVANGGTPPLTYTWTGFINGQTDVVLTSKDTICVITVSDKNGCTTSASDIVTVINNMTQNVSASASSVCAGRSVTLSDNVNGGITPYSYDWKQGINSIGNNQSVTVTTFSTTTYTVTSCCNCDGSSLQSTITVNVISAPAISVCCDSSIQAGQAVQLIANGSTYAYDWSPSNGLSCIQCPTPVATPTINTTYYVTSTDTADGCTTRDSVTILVGSGTLVFYHGITPNGDGHNDVWVIDNIETYDNTSVAIFNRWGIEVWSASNYNNTTIAWSGNDQSGKPLPDATYFYVVKVNGTTYKGWVQLTR
jgi:gliding motility-associated-like protein